MWVRDSGPPETGRSVAHELHVWDPQGLIRTWKGVWGSDVNRTSGEDWWFVCSFIENSDFFFMFLVSRDDERIRRIGKDSQRRP